MNKFIHNSINNQKIYTSLQMAKDLPINILVYGNSGLGKKTLINEHFNDIEIFKASDLEYKINNKSIDIDSYQTIILHDINEVINKNEFLLSIKNIKTIATSLADIYEFNSYFALKLNIQDLENNPKDLEQLRQIYINDAKKLSNNECKENDIVYDLSNNAISLKKSIYKSFFTVNMNYDDLSILIQNYLSKELNNNKTYQELIKIFEIPLLKEISNLYKSQVKMSNALDINRITLRKKLKLYENEINNHE